MASLFKQTYTCKKTGKLKQSAKWYGKFRGADGRICNVALSPNKVAAQGILTELLKNVELERSGVRDNYADSRSCALTETLADYRQHLLDKGATEKETAQSARRCEMVFDACEFAILADLDATPVERWLADRRRLPKKGGGFGPVTSNHYRRTLVAFGNWLVKAKRSSENPFRHIPRVKADVDIRHRRRALTDGEFSRLLDAAHAGSEFRGLSGPARRMLYYVAGFTGLRASELASLTPSSFDLGANPPTVTVEAAYSKHRRKDRVPLHPALIAELPAWLTGKAADSPLWPGKWAKHNEAVNLIQRDLLSARKDWIAEASTEAERAEREQSDFLKYRNAAGEVADFHSLRHTFVTNLVNAGVSPKDAKELARHSTITLTMDRYSHVGIKETASAVASISAPIRTSQGTSREHRSTQSVAESEDAECVLLPTEPKVEGSNPSGCTS